MFTFHHIQELAGIVQYAKEHNPADDICFTLDDYIEQWCDVFSEMSSLSLQSPSSSEYVPLKGKTKAQLKPRTITALEVIEHVTAILVELERKQHLES